MLNKAYLAKNLDDIIYEAKQDYEAVETIYVSETSEQDIIRLHQKSLFSKSIKLFLGMDECKQEFSLKLLENGITADVIWGFKTLPRNYTLHKKLSTLISIEECKDLTKPKNKKDFIFKLLQEFHLPIFYADILQMQGAENKFILQSEVEKLKLVEELPKEERLKVICKFNTSADCFNFIDAFLKKDIVKCLAFADKVSSETSPPAFYALLSKKIRAYILLSKGDINQASKVWNHYGPHLTEAIGIAKTQGFNYWIDLHQTVQNLFGNLYNNSDFHTRLCKFINILLDS